MPTNESELCNNPIIGESVKKGLTENIINTKSTYKNPARPCPFCPVRMRKLSRHILVKHKNEKEVLKISKLPREEKLIALENLRKQNSSGEVLDFEDGISGNDFCDDDVNDPDYSQSSSRTSQISNSEWDKLISRKCDKRGKSLTCNQSSPTLTSQTENIIYTKSMYKKKPARPCPFCPVRISRLSRHILTKHKNEKKVLKISNLPRKDKLIALENMRKQAMFHENVQKTKNNDFDLHFIRKQGGNAPMSICSGCKGYYKTKTIWMHKRSCSEAWGSLENTSLNKNHLKMPTNESELCNNAIMGEDFRKEILNRFKKSEVGELCRNDPFIRLIGYRYYQAKMKRDVLMNNMRILARTVIAFRDEMQSKDLMCIDLFQMNNFHALENAINRLTMCDQDKASFKLKIGYVLKYASRVLYAFYLMAKNKEKSEELQVFIDVLSLHWSFIFLPALRTIQANSKKTNTTSLNDFASFETPGSLISGDVNELHENSIDYIPLEENLTCKEEESIPKISVKEKRRNYTLWSKESKKQLFTYFQSHLTKLKCPSKEKIEEYISTFDCNITYGRIRNKINNEVKFRRKMLNSLQKV